MTTTSRDGCVVPTGPLSDLVRGFVDDWLKQRPPLAGRRNLPADTIEPVSAYDYLAARTGLPKQVIQRVRDRVSPHTELRIADKLVNEIGNPGMFHDDETRGVKALLPIEPNPRARADAQIECCGRVFSRDSFTGSAARRRRTRA